MSNNESDYIVRNRRQQEHIEELQSRVVQLETLLKRYRLETPLGNQPYMIAHEVDEAISSSPSDYLKQVRNQVREECAKLCADRSLMHWNLRGTMYWSSYVEGMSDEADNCAEAIRATKEK